MKRELGSNTPVFHTIVRVDDRYFNENATGNEAYPIVRKQPINNNLSSRTDFTANDININTEMRVSK